MQKMTRKAYSDLFGITVGDSVRLGDTHLWAKVEKDLTLYGEEAVYGGGKTARDGMGQSATELRTNAKVMDLVITNALILDHRLIYKADIGVKDGKIAAIGHAGNPAITDKIDMIIGVSTEVFSGENKIFTAGGVDTHVHILTPQIVESALDIGTTTLIAGGTGLNDGTKGTTCTPGAWWIERMLQSHDDMPINIGLLGKGQGADKELMEEQIVAGACGIKIHEDWGATRSAIEYTMRACDELDVQLSIHTDTLNEGGYVEHSIEAFDHRVIHAYHCEGAGGGHAPDIMEVVSVENVLPSSTNPTIPYTQNTIAEHVDMLMVCHHLNPKVPEDVAFAESRIRKQTIAAEDILHDLGAISMTSTDTMAMGRIAETPMRTWQIANKMKEEFGFLKGDSEYSDNNRIKRYIAKYTINPAITHGISDYVGSLDVGKIADIVCWEPKFFGAKPYAVFKAGVIARAVCGESNASITTCEPMIMRNEYAAYGLAAAATSVFFVSKAAMIRNIKQEYGLKRTCLPVRNCRNISKADMINNNTLPRMSVEPKTFDVKVAKEDFANWLADASKYESLPMNEDKTMYYISRVEPQKVNPLAQLYFLY